MFPFLRKTTNNEHLLPTVIDHNNMDRLTLTLTTSAEKNWKNWINMSYGKGIITTFSPDFIEYFYKTLHALQYLKK